MARRDAKPNTQRVINRDANAALRAAQAVQLRCQKLTFAQIAERVGYASAGACRNAIQRELNRVVVTNVADLRREEARMYDDLQAAIYPVAVGPREVTDALSGDESTEAHDKDDEKDDESAASGEKSGPRKRRHNGPNLFAVDRVLAISKARRELLGLDVQPSDVPQTNVRRIYEHR